MSSLVLRVLVAGLFGLVSSGACGSTSASSSPSPSPSSKPSSEASPTSKSSAPSTREPPAEAAESELATMTLPPRPDWADKYAGSNPDERFLDIDALMKRHGLDRARAVELQNHFRDLTRAEPQGDRDAQYAEALDRAKRGIFEDGRDLERLAKARFIVVFDLDETLLDQRFDDEALGRACHDLAVPKGEGKVRHVKFTPGGDEAIRRVRQLGGEVVLFSANLDDRCYAIAQRWRIDDTPILEHPAVAAFLTNSHLILQPKQSGPPVSEPSKDLRIIDPELTRAIIIDDNPRRLFQFRNVRLFKKFQADPYCTASAASTGSTADASELRAAHDAALSVVLDEIEDSVRYMDAHPGASFAQAYLPYTILGHLTVQWLRAGDQRTEAEAIEHLRAHPELADERF